MCPIPADGFYLDSPLGPLSLCLDPSGALIRLEFGAGGAAVAPRSAAGRRLAVALSAYFDDAASGLDLPVAARGTDFQCRVWEALRAIPCGETRSYGELAAQLRSSARAVGQACRRNPVPLLVPCHRVVSRGAIGGFAGQRAGWYTGIKRWLLAHEAGLSPSPLNLPAPPPAGQV